MAPFRRLSVSSADGNRVERFPRSATSAYQLDTFAAAVLPASRSATAPEALNGRTATILGNMLRIWLG